MATLFRRKPSAPVELPETEQPAAAGVGVFLGVMPSEVDEPDAVGEGFAAVAALTEEVVAAWRARALSEDEALVRLSVLRLHDADGTEWVLGATSQRWFQRPPGGSWKLATPPPWEGDALAQSARDAADALDALDAERLQERPTPAPVAVFPVAPEPAEPETEPEPREEEEVEVETTALPQATPAAPADDMAATIAALAAARGIQLPGQ